MAMYRVEFSGFSDLEVDDLAEAIENYQSEKTVYEETEIIRVWEIDEFGDSWLKFDAECDNGDDK